MYTTKDSGKREEYQSGMRRDTQEGKPRYDLIPTFMLKRRAELMERGARHYGDRNRENANSQEEMDRFKASAMRHMFQWANGEEDEDHQSAVVFNLFAYGTIKDKLSLDKK